MAKNEALLRFDGAVKRNPEVDRWFDFQPDDLGDIARTWFARICACGDDVLELIHDDAPTACVGDAAFAYVDVFSHHVNVGFFLGAHLHDPLGLLEGTGKRMRHVKLRPGHVVDERALLDLIAAAYRDIRRRLQVSDSGGRT